MKISIIMIRGLLFVTALVNALPPFGIQSGDGGEGSSYAGSMAYDADNNVVFVTGATYSSFFDLGTSTNIQATTTSNCFFSVLQVPTTKEKGPSFLYKDRLGSTDSVESCSSLVKVDSSKVYIGGQSEEGGLLTSLRSSGSDKATQYGTVLDIDVDLRLSTGESSSTSLLGGRLMHDEPAQSTRAMTSMPLGDAIFVVMQESDLSTQNPDFDATEAEPNLVRTKKWGNNYLLNVKKLNRKQLISGDASTAATFDSSSWNTDIASNQNPVDVAGIKLLNSTTLVLAGSAIGSDGVALPVSTTNTWGGFVTLLHASDGTVMGAKRIEAQVNKKTRIEGMCADPNKPGFIYIVGSTNGKIGMYGFEGEKTTAFLMRLNVPDLKVEWSKEFKAKAADGSTAGTAEIMGYACAVTDKGVYVGGIVKDGAAVDEGSIHDTIKPSAGKDDIWVGLVGSTSSPEDLVWIRQLGTSQNEFLTDLQVDQDGDVLVLGNTEGSFMRQKKDAETTSDVFLLRLAKLNGEYPVPVEEGFTPTTGVVTPTPPPVTQPTTGVVTPTPSPVTQPTSPPVTQPTSPPAAQPTSPPVPKLKAPETNDGGGERMGGIIAVLVVVSAIGLIAGCFLYQRRHQHDHQDAYITHVESYLKGFDDVQVDLKHSATGGWHGTYVNQDGGPRFRSVHPGDETISFGSDGAEMSPLRRSSFVQASLFTIDDEEPELGGKFDGGGQYDGNSSYRGLVNVYNNYDLSHHRLPSARPQPLVEISIDEESEVLHPAAGWGGEII